jgi:hypothetical protein
VLGVPAVVAVKAKRYPRLADTNIAESEFREPFGQVGSMISVFRGASGISPSIEWISDTTALADHACGEFACG